MITLKKNPDMRLFTILLFLVITGPLAAQWQQMKGPEGACALQFEAMGDQLSVATDAELYLSDDEGLSWQLADFLPDDANIIHLLVEGDSIFIAAIDQSQPSYARDRLFYSTDGGVAWANVPLPGSLSSIYQETLFGAPHALYYNRRDELFKYDLTTQDWQVVPVPADIYVIAGEQELLVAAAYDATYLSDDDG